LYGYEYAWIHKAVVVVVVRGVERGMGMGRGIKEG